MPFGVPNKNQADLDGGPTDPPTPSHMLGQRRLITGFTALVACAVGGCAEPDAATPMAERYDSAGVTVISNGAEDRPLRWQFERLYSLGGAAEGPESFFHLTANTVATDAASNLYVLDATSHRVVSFSPDGEHRLSVGAEGEGPGELQFPSGLSVTEEGAISVFDYGKAALVRFAPDGSTLPQLPFPDFPVPVPQKHMVEVGGQTVVFSSRTAGDGREYVLKAMTPGDTTVHGVLPVVEPGVINSEECGVRMRLPPVFAPRFTWDALSNRIVFSRGAAYDIAVLDDEVGRALIRRDFPVRSATESDARAEIGEGAPVSVGGRPPCTISVDDIVSGRGYASEIPWIEAVALTPWGEIWAERKVLGPDAAGPIDVFSESGEYLGTIASEISFPLAFLAGRRIAVAETDEQDITRLVIFAIREAP